VHVFFKGILINKKKPVTFMDKGSKAIEDGFSNSLWNILKPFTMSKGIMGTASYVAIETAVGQVIRRVMRAPYNVRESLELHTYSVPFLGQTNFGDDYKAYPAKDATVDFVEEMTEGGKAIPAAIVGFIAMKLRKEGMKVPAFANRDFLYMLVGKLLSRPLTSYVYQSLPEDIEIGLTVINALANKQRQVIKSVKDQAKA
jgi:hypothetical protein